jgi:hypothetical protein
MLSPGPLHVKLKNQISFIQIDSQWWLQRGIVFSGKRKQQRILTERLDSMCSQAQSSGDLIFLAAHHPVVSNGKRIHHKQPFRFLLNFSPLKLLAIAGLDRGFRQDLMQPRYKRYRKAMAAVFEKYPGMIYLSSHEYNMQYIVDNQIHHLISGAGSVGKQIDRYKFPARFMDDLQPGFFKITVHKSGNVFLHAYGANDRGEYWKTLMFTHPFPQN